MVVKADLEQVPELGDEVEAKMGVEGAQGKAETVENVSERGDVRREEIKGLGQLSKMLEDLHEVLIGDVVANEVSPSVDLTDLLVLLVVDHSHFGNEILREVR